MSDGLSALKEEDVQRLARLVESLEASTFDYLQLQVGDLKVTIGKGAVPMNAPGLTAPQAPAVAGPGASAAPSASAVAALGTPAFAAPEAPVYTPPPSLHGAWPSPAQNPTSGKPTASPGPADTIDIKAQIMGMFYPQPEPGSPPFVSIGVEVKEDTTVCLIEVMKTFNAMTAGVKGVITEICVKNAQLVEYGQVLFRIRPS